MDSFEDHINENTVDFSESATIGESFNAGVGRTMLQFNTLAPIFGRDIPIKNRNNKVKELIDSGEIPFELSEKYTTRHSRSGTKIDFDAIARDPEVAKFEIPNNDTLKEQTREEVKMMMDYAKSVEDRQASFGPKAAMFGGDMVGGMADPISVPSMLIGFGAASKGISLAQSVLRGFATAGASGAGSQAMQEPFVHNWNDYADIDYSLQDSIANVAFTGLFSGTLGGLSAGLSKMLSNPDLEAGLIEKGLSDREVIVAKKPIENLKREVDEAELISDENLELPKTAEPKSAEDEFNAFLEQDRMKNPHIVEEAKKIKDDPETLVRNIEAEQEALDKMPNLTPKEERVPEVSFGERDVMLQERELLDIESLDPKTKILTGYSDDGSPIMSNAKQYLARAEKDRAAADSILECLRK